MIPSTPIRQSGRIGDGTSPACAFCGHGTARLDVEHRRCEHCRRVNLVVWNSSEYASAIAWRVELVELVEP